jgi:hypothetical protein
MLDLPALDQETVAGKPFERGAGARGIFRSGGEGGGHAPLADEDVQGVERLREAVLRHVRLLRAGGLLRWVVIIVLGLIGPADAPADAFPGVCDSQAQLLQLVRSSARPIVGWFIRRRAHTHDDGSSASLLLQL